MIVCGSSLVVRIHERLEGVFVDAVDDCVPHHADGREGELDDMVHW